MTDEPDADDEPLLEGLDIVNGPRILRLVDEIDTDELQEELEANGIELPDEPNESDTERDGFLSYAAEVHALSVGLATGLVVGATQRWELGAAVVAVALGEERVRNKAGRDIQREPWYALGGFAIGFAVGFATTNATDVPLL